MRTVSAARRRQAVRRRVHRLAQRHHGARLPAEPVQPDGNRDRHRRLHPLRGRHRCRTGASTYGVAAGAQFSISASGQAPTETGEIIILSNTAVANAATATPVSGDATSKGAAIDWIHATIATGAALTPANSAATNIHDSFTDSVRIPAMAVFTESKQAGQSEATPWMWRRCISGHMAPATAWC